MTPRPAWFASSCCRPSSGELRPAKVREIVAALENGVGATAKYSVQPNVVEVELALTPHSVLRLSSVAMPSSANIPPSSDTLQASAAAAHADDPDSHPLTHTLATPATVVPSVGVIVSTPRALPLESDADCRESA